MLPLAVAGGAVRIKAQAAKSVHTSIMQILYALSQAVPDFAISDASGDFLSTETRLGLPLPKSDQIKPTTNVSEPA
jgi:hypothetical protein